MLNVHSGHRADTGNMMSPQTPIHMTDLNPKLYTLNPKLTGRYRHYDVPSELCPREIKVNVTNDAAETGRTRDCYSHQQLTPR